MKLLKYFFFMMLQTYALSVFPQTSRGLLNSLPLFYSLESQEAVLRYEAQIYVSPQLSKELIVRKINEQVKFLFGALSNSERLGAPRNKFKVEVLNSTVFGRWNQIHYRYEGIVQIMGDSQKVEFPLPLNPDLIYKASETVNGRGEVVYPCTDSEHLGPQYFWYFFNIHARGCPLKEERDYQVVHGNLEFLPSTQETYPEYQRLIKNDVLEMSLFIGMNDSSESKDPTKSKDVGAYGARYIRQYLLQQGYQSHVFTSSEMQKNFSFKSSSQLAYYEVFQKMTSRGLLKINFFFGPTALFGADIFHAIYGKALKDSTVIVYDGHSGLGEYLSLEKILWMSGVQISMPQDQYQILFMNGCSTYPYYADPYFQLKKNQHDPQGTKNLDIITNGLSTLFAAMPQSNMSLLKAMELYMSQGIRVSYQKIIQQADSQNLVAVLGDEDNNE